MIVKTKHAYLLQGVTATRHSRPAVLALLLWLVQSVAWGVTVVERDFSALVSSADSILIGTAKEQTSYWRDPVVRKLIDTDIAFSNVEVIKGSVDSSRFVLTVAGGRVGPYTQSIVGLPQIALGSRYLLFVKDNQRAIFPLVGADKGIYRIIPLEKDKWGVATANGAPLRNLADIDLPIEVYRNLAGAPQQALPLDVVLGAIRSELRATAPANSDAP